jgi:RHS repeat-associated protein
MQHDVISALLPPISLADDIHSLSDTRTLSVLSAMKAAGRSLLASARRHGGILSALMMAAAALGATQAADAATVTITITGTVYSGTDISGAFGFPPNTDLSGMAYTLTFTFDDTKGTESFVNCLPSCRGSYIDSTTTSNPGTAVLQIGNGSFAFATLPPGPPGSDAYLIAGEGGWYAFSVGSGSLPNADDLQGTIYPATGTALTTNPSWEAAFSDSNLYHYSSDDWIFTFYTRHQSPYLDANGYLEVSSITVSGPQGTNPVAKTLGGTGGNGTCGCSGSEPAMQNTGMVQVAEPIEVGTGNAFEQVTDYKSAGPNVLAFIRYYNSLGNANGMNSFVAEMGTNWRTNYDRVLHLGPSTVVAERPDGQQLTFTLTGGVWQSDSDVDVKLTQSGSTWRLTDHDDTVETYNTANGQFYDLSVSYGQLASIKARNGYTQTLSYSANVMTVTDSYGRTLTLTSANGLLETVTTPDTLVLTYGYTAVSGGSQLTSASYNTNPVTSQTYLYENAASPFALTGIIDENGSRYATWTYDGAGRGTSSQMGTGSNLTTLTYNLSGTTTVTNALGVEDSYTFQTLQGVPKVTQISRAATSTTAAATRTFGYDSNGYLNSETDWNGNKTAYVNNAHGQPTTINEAVGTTAARTTTIAYDTTCLHEPHQIVTPGLTSMFTYDGSCNPLTRTDHDTTTNTAPYSTNGQTRVTKWTWSSTGQEASVQLPRTDVTARTSFGYGSKGTLSSVTDALGHKTQITNHTGGGLPKTIIDPNNLTTTLAYDTRLNLHTSTLSRTAGNLVTTWTHDAANNLTAVQLPDKSKLTYAYDTAHRLTTITDLFSHTVNYTLDALSDKTLVQVENSSKAVTEKHSATFDSLGRISTDVGGVAQTTAYTYDANGNVLTVIPPSPSGMVTFTYDALNRLSTRVDPSPGGTTTDTYDAHNRVLSVKDAYGHTTSYVYDGFGDRTQTVSPDSGTITYTYDPDSNLTQIVMGGPRTTQMTYDALDRPLATIYPSDATLNAARIYDQATGHGFGIGRLTGATDQVGSLSLTYDERGNVTQESRVVTGAGTLNTSTTYDAASRMSGIGYPSGTLVAYGRDSMGRVTSITAQPLGATTPTNVVTGVTYEPFGPETGLAFGNGIAGSYKYDLDYRPTSRTDTGTATVQKLTYAYNLNDSVKTITDGVNAANTQTLKYDALDRLTSATSGTGGYGAQSFKWDILGNPTTQVVNGTTTTYSRVSGTNKLSQWVTGSTTDTVGYVSTGNISSITSGTTALDTLSYSQANRLSSAKTLSTSATYKYDFVGQRLEKSLSGSHPILYEYGITDGALLSENDLHQGQTADYIYLNGRPIGEVNPTSDKLYFTNTDRMGIPQKLTDANQAAAWSTLYEPFGSTDTTLAISLATQSLRLPGQQYDPETGLNHNGFRDYSAGLTRYVNSDPIGLAGGVNTYQYVTGNPFKYTDRTGLAEVPSIYRYTSSGETYYRYESANPLYSKVGPNGQLAPNTFAGVSGDQPLTSSQVIDFYNLPTPSIPRTNAFCIRPPAGTLVVGPKPVSGGTGYEVLFPAGSPPNTVAEPPAPLPTDTSGGGGGGGGFIDPLHPYDPVFIRRTSGFPEVE